MYEGADAGGGGVYDCDGGGGAAPAASGRPQLAQMLPVSGFEVLQYGQFKNPPYDCQNASAAKPAPLTIPLMNATIDHVLALREAA